MHWELGPVTVGGTVDKFHVCVGSQSELNIPLFHSTGIFRGINNSRRSNVGSTESAFVRTHVREHTQIVVIAESEGRTEFSLDTSTNLFPLEILE